MKKFVFILLIIIILIVINLLNNNNQITTMVHDYNNLCSFYTKNSEHESPIIILNGNENIYLNINNNYYESGVKALDNCDGNITDKVKIQGKVNTKKEGIYKIKYQVQDSDNNTKEIERKIHVQQTKDDLGVIYLTFDDGPSKSITGRVLDILKQENVKATFFVINHSSELDYLIKRIYEEEHTLAIHSYTHDYSYIYSSIDNYFNDLAKIEEKIYNITGQKSNIIRFPGGSSNSVSKKYSTGIMTKLSQQVTKLGYKYYDWNIDSFDAGGVKSSDEVYYNVINNLSLNKVNMVLLHDFESNYYTLDALPKIIKYAKENGYLFKAITNNTIQIKHNINN